MKRFVTTLASLVLGIGVFGAKLAINQTPQPVNATDTSATAGTIDLTSNQSLTTTSVPWAMTNYVFYLTGSCYRSSNNNTTSTITFLDKATRPFLGNPTSITLKLNACGDSDTVPAFPTSISALDSSGAVISASTITGTLGGQKNTYSDISYLLSSSVSLAYGIQLTWTQNNSKHFLTKSATVTYTYNASTDPSVTIEGNRSACIGDSVTLSAAKANADAYTVSWSTTATSAYSFNTTTLVVTCNSAGTGTITATLYDGEGAATSYSDSITFTVLTPSLNITTSKVAVGASNTLAVVSTNISASAVYTYASETTSVLSIDTNGTYHPLATGTSLVTVTASVGGNAVTSAEATITVIEYPTKATFTGTSMNLPTAVSSGVAAATDSKSCYSFSCLQVKNDSGYIHFSPSNAGYVYNTIAWAGTISRIVLSFNTSNAIVNTKFSVTAGTSANPATAAVIVSNTDGTANTSHYCDVSAAGGQYFKIANNGTDDLKIKTLYVETASDEVSEFVTYMSGKSLGDGNGVTDTATCLANYRAAKQLILYMSAAAITAFRNDVDANVVSQRIRYVNWCTANGDASPWSGALASGSANFVRILSDNPWTGDALAIGALILVAAAATGYYVFRKKKDCA